MKKHLMIIFCAAVLAAAAGGDARAGILCPGNSRGLSVKGPAIKKKISGQVAVRCEYYLERKLAGVVQAYYYNNSGKSPECGAAVFKSGKAASATHRVFMTFADNNPEDDYRESLWHDLGLHLIRLAENYALPCEIERRTIIGPGG